jgi:hypothetical protein
MHFLRINENPQDNSPLGDYPVRDRVNNQFASLKWKNKWVLDIFITFKESLFD